MSAAGLVDAELAEHATVVRALSDALGAGIAELCVLTLDTVRKGGTLLFCGNGGSAADAQHLAAEYVVRFARERGPVRAVALTTDTSVLTAGANDFGFETVFDRQLRALGRRGDLLVLHSTSGESENLLHAARVARDLGITTVALLAKGGGALGGVVDHALIVPTDSTARAQEMHLLIGHIVCEHVDRELAADGGGEEEAV